jgi:O-antigen/teichoic acid export membrane protein
MSFPIKELPIKEIISISPVKVKGCAVGHSSPGKTKNESEGYSLVTAAKGGGVSLIGATGGAILSIFLQVLVSRFYGPKYYGIFFTGLLVCHLSQSISALGLHKAGMRFLSIGHERSDHNMILDVFRTVAFIPFLFGIIIAIVLYFMSSFISITCFRNSEMVVVLKLFSIAVPFFALLQVTAELSRGFKTTKYAVIIENLYFPFFQIVIFITLHALGYNFLSAVYSFLFAVIVCSLSMLLTVRNQIQNFMAPKQVRQLSTEHSIFPRNWKPILAYSLPLTPFGLLFLGGSSMDIIMLNILTNSEGVGEYAAAARWVTFFSFIVGSLNFIFGPLIAGKLGVNKIEEVRILNAAATRWMLFITLPISIFLMLAREPMMLIFGEQFLQYGPTVLLILGLGSLFIALSGSGGLLLILGGHQYIELGVLGSFVLLNILLNLLLIPQYGIIGAALATIVSNMVTILLRILVIYRYFKIHPFSSHLVVPIVTFSILIIGGLLIQSAFQTSDTLNLGLGVGSSILVMISIIAAGLDDHDRDLFIMLRKKLFRRSSITRTSTLT